MSYQIKVKPVGNEISFKYNASTHPAKGDYIYLRDQRYKVVHVFHILTTQVGIMSETHYLSHVELTVVLE